MPYSPYPDHAWAQNKLKLHQSYEWLHEQKKILPTLDVNEVAAKHEYIRRAGALLDVPKKESAPVVEPSLEAVEEKPKKRVRKSTAVKPIE